MAIAGSIEFIKTCDEYRKKQLIRHPQGFVNYYIRRVISRVFSRRELEYWFSAIEKTARNNKPSKHCTSSTGRWHYFGETQKSKIFFPLKSDVFCGTPAWIINDANWYLTHNYGVNYMKIPDDNKRESHRL